MAIYDGTITYGGETLYVRQMSPERVQKTIKQVVGAELVEVEVLGLRAKQWRLRIQGIITGTDATDLSNKRSALEELDDTNPHALVDGHHNGNYYIVPGSLKFSDSGNTIHSMHTYTMELVER